MKEISQTENKENLVEGIAIKKTSKKAIKVKAERALTKFKTVNAKVAIDMMPELRELLNSKEFKVIRLEVKIKTSKGKEISSIFKIGGTKEQGFTDSEY